MAVRVRLATLDEAPLVRRIMQAAFAEYQGALPVDSGAHTETVDDVLAVMRVGGAVLAYAGSEPVGSARYTLEDEAVYVGRVAVLPSHRRRGVASAIMLFLEDIARAEGRDHIRIGVRDSLPSNVGLYQALGYELVSINPHPRGPDRVWTMIKHV
ncbi:MAG TPA: GNAT family N-acetyltransferase [Chloroflexota bacterium]